MQSVSPDPTSGVFLATRGFTHTTLAARVVFGRGVFDQLPREAELLGMQRVLVICTPGQRGCAQRAATLLESKCADIFAGAVMHVPVECARDAAALARRVNADGLVALGGGSTVGVAKAVALQAGMPIIAIPTTYSGSEMTPIYGITEGGIKRTGRDTRVLPRTVLYDPLLSTTVPPLIAAASGMNAVAHAVEGLYADDTNPVTQMLAQEGVRALAQGLPRLADSAVADAARCHSLYGAWLCGVVLGSVSMGLHHKLCHVLGGSFDLPHAQTHSVLLPHVAAYNAPAASAAMQRIAVALGGVDAPTGLYELAKSLGLPLSLQQIGMRREDLDRAAELATKAAYANPRAVTRADIRELLEQAFVGGLPRLH